MNFILHVSIMNFTISIEIHYFPKIHGQVFVDTLFEGFLKKFWEGFDKNHYRRIKSNSSIECMGWCVMPYLVYVGNYAGVVDHETIYSNVYLLKLGF